MRHAGLVELHAVVAVATHKSFRAAAAELSMSPSALSHAISALEQRMGVRLFHRTTRSVSLSDAGEQFLARLRPALSEISDAMAAADEFRETIAGTLRINTSAGGARLVVMAIVLEFLRRYPQMSVELVTSDALVDIAADGFDVGFRDVNAVPKDMIAVPCSPDVRYIVVGSPAYFAACPPPLVPGDLAHHVGIRRRWKSGAIYRWEFENRGSELVIDVKGTLTLDNDDLIVDAAVAGAGLAYVAEFMVSQHLCAGRLVRVLDDWTPVYPGPCLFYSSHRLIPPGLRAFLDVAREFRHKSG